MKEINYKTWNKIKTDYYWKRNKKKVMQRWENVLKKLPIVGIKLFPEEKEVKTKIKWISGK